MTKLLLARDTRRRLSANQSVFSAAQSLETSPIQVHATSTRVAFSAHAIRHSTCSQCVWHWIIVVPNRRFADMSLHELHL